MSSGAIAGVVVGAIAAVCLVAFLALSFLRGRRKQGGDEAEAISPVIDGYGGPAVVGKGSSLKVELDGKGPMKTELDGRGSMRELPSQGLEHEIAG